MTNHYQNKYDEFITNIQNNMYTFEVTKCCGYSTFITIYKTQTLIDLYSTIIHHFGNNMNITDLYFYTPLNERITIPITNKTISEFLTPHIVCNPSRLIPIYPLPKPVIYRLFLDDGHCNNQQCMTIHYRHT